MHVKFYKYDKIVVYNLHCWTRFWFAIPHVIESLILFFDISGTVKIKPNVLLLNIITIFQKIIYYFIQWLTFNVCRIWLNFVWVIIGSDIWCVCAYEYGNVRLFNCNILVTINTYCINKYKLMSFIVTYTDL